MKNWHHHRKMNLYAIGERNPIRGQVYCVGVIIVNEEDRKFYREQKKRIIEYYKACKKEQEKILKEKKISSTLDTDRVVSDSFITVEDLLDRFKREEKPTIH